ncbi:MAG TPA: NYN domain-containing protein [Polyangiaceae bacterium]|nr:NYN domain-containing protein [Polyangiaceae bacterium]
MDRSAIFVDAGYLFASGSKLVAGERHARSQLHLDHERVLELLTRLAHELTELPLLRIYWYDGASAGPNPAHVALAYRPSLKLRLGLVTEQGQQGVDELITDDLVTLAKNRAMSDAVLLSGDDDLRAAVEATQALGVRVHLLGIAPIRENQAAALVQAADTSRELTDGEVRSFLSSRTK